MKTAGKGLVRLGLILGIGLLPLWAIALSPEVRNLGDKLNSRDSDFAPIVSPDGNDLYFASDREGGYGGQDIWVTHRDRNGEWGDPKNLGPPINDKRNQGPDCFFTDDNDKESLYLTYCNPTSSGLCDIYMSRKAGDAWGVPDKLPEPINTKYSDANASWDYIHQVLYFVSTRPGGMPGEGPKKMPGESSYDVWMCPKTKDGKWGEAKNLGAPVNTPDWEGVAFYHAADDALYFSSNGHGGQGKADIFRTRLLPGGKWSEPENMEPVNTPENDMYFSISAAGDLAYFSSDASGTNGLEDIYTVPLSVILTPEQLAKVTKKIPQGVPVKKGPQAGHIASIYFDFDHAEIRAGETVKLDGVADLMNQNPQIKIEIAGHACSVGKQDYNLVLSKNRAESARRYLISKGISADRIIVNYYGESRPAEPNDPSKGNPLNRRVEISIVQ